MSKTRKKRKKRKKRLTKTMAKTRAKILAMKMMIKVWARSKRRATRRASPRPRPGRHLVSKQRPRGHIAKRSATPPRVSELSCFAPETVLLGGSSRHPGSWIHFNLGLSVGLHK